jgi:phosphoribosyl-dephospho-CoA transferase
MTSLPRHTRVWPTAAGYAILASDADDSSARTAIVQWGARGWPLVVRRRDENEPCLDQTVAIGLALPPSLGKHRFKLRLTHGEIASHAAPLTLDEVVAGANSKLTTRLMPLARAATHERIRLRVFGSTALHVQTGLDYLHAGSDLDLLVEPNTRREVDAAIALLERFQQRVAMRLDGEIVFPGGGAVAWREWAYAGRAERVLVKNIDRVVLMERHDLLLRFDGCKAAA